MKKLIAAFIVFSLVTVLVVACGNSSSGGGSGSNDVHMNSTNFVQSTVTISKGTSINLIDDVAVVHIIEKGSWVNDTPRLETEKGAPTVNDLQFNGNDSHTIGPFNTIGTYHLYCTVHPGMNLTVRVK